MDLFQEIFVQAVMRGDIQVTFFGKEHTVAEVMEGICYQTLEKIKTIIADDSLSDNGCFMKIEEIVCALEEIGVDCGGRHDFG